MSVERNLVISLLKLTKEGPVLIEKCQSGRQDTFNCHVKIAG